VKTYNIGKIINRLSVKINLFKTISFLSFSKEKYKHCFPRQGLKNIIKLYGNACYHFRLHSVIIFIHSTIITPNVIAVVRTTHNYLTPFLLYLAPLLVVVLPDTNQFLHFLILMIRAVTYITTIWCLSTNFHIFMFTNTFVLYTSWCVDRWEALLGSVLHKIMHPNSEEVNSPTCMVTKISFRLLATILWLVILLAIKINHLLMTCRTNSRHTEQECDTDCWFHLIWMWFYLNC